jgi:hypothetical protein
MGACKYCGQPAGLFRKEHAECQKRHEKGRQAIIDLIAQSLSSSSSVHALQEQIRKIAENSFIGPREQRELAATGWVEAVNRGLEDDVLSEGEERRLVELKNSMSLSADDVDEQAFSRLTKSRIIRSLLNNIVPKVEVVQGNVRVILRNRESIVWIFDSKYWQDKTRRHYEGLSLGLSIRVEKGLYYRIGAFKGYPVDNIQRKHIDDGKLIVTNKSIYFDGSNTSLMIPYSKILSFHPLTNRIAVFPSSANAKPFLFDVDDVWFAYNLLTNLARLTMAKSRR